jgi:hypothetical protein
VAGLQTSLQAFPNPACFSASLSKESFGGFVEFQGVARVPNQKGAFPNLFVTPASFSPHSRLRRTAFRRFAP